MTSCQEQFLSAADKYIMSIYWLYQVTVLFSAETYLLNNILG